ncbi:MAG TPA: DUF1566 domain-containing protein [Polyangiales bacterium]|nr:DUF1566 domain-containing protein [Polyangiales bacterium]
MRSLTASLLLLLAFAARADAPASRYKVDTDSVTDTRTGLVWERQTSAPSGTLSAASTYCARLTLAGGGWRLPGVKELLTLVDPTRYDPAIDPMAFPGTVAGHYWTANRYTDLLGSPSSGGLIGFTVYFKTGAGAAAKADALGSTRCVR